MNKTSTAHAPLETTTEERPLSELARSRRLELHLTQTEVAERMGGAVYQADVSQIERGVVRSPRRERLVALAAALELPYETVFAASGWGQAYREVNEPERDDDPALADLARIYRRLSDGGRASVLTFAGYVEHQERSARRKAKRGSGGGDD
ncbi:MAG TPA: helix-turn-helix transcriptional regulator [Thermomicrobiales bacterium]|jgi:transcriptional regulator with XRE-family HTH domain|nr:helix-turn-helix transcriptional regulator [Thermomicrobiales bacterium]